MKTNQVPVIDIAKLRSAETLAALDQTYRDRGFFQITGHGMPESVASALFAASHASFAQPDSLG